MRQKQCMSSNEEKNLGSKILNTSIPVNYFLNKSYFAMETKPLSMNELKDALYSLKSNKSPDYGDFSYNAIKNCFDSLCEPLKYLFNLSVKKSVFPEDLKMTRVTPIYKGKDSSDVSNYKYLCSHAFPKYLSA